MNMVQVKDNQVVQSFLPNTGELKDDRCVSNYNLLPADILKAEGWLPLEQTMPTYNQETQYLQHDKYTILVNKVVETFIVMDIPIV